MSRILKTFAITLCLTFFSLNTYNYVSAQINESEYYQIEISYGTQSAFTQKIPLKIKFKPNIDSEKTDITLDVPLGLKVEYGFTNYFPTKTGQIYTVTAYLIPESAGSYSITANVTAWNGTNYTNSSQMDISVSSDLRVSPKQSGYTIQIALKYFFVVVLIGIGIYFVYIFFGKGVNFMKEWLKPPDL